MPFPGATDPDKARSRKPGSRFAAAVVLSTVLPLVVPSLGVGVASAKPIDPTETDCFWQLREARGPRISCKFVTRMSADERAEFKKVTRGYVDDAHCVITIDIERALVDTALGAVDDHVFEAPKQNASCTLSSGETVYPITLTFAPRVEFKAGIAVEASPQLDDVTGVSRLLWWPVAAWVNRTGMIEDPTLRIVNAYKKRFGRVPEVLAADPAAPSGP